MEYLTAEELARLPGADRTELVRGLPRVSEPPGGVHGQLTVRLSYLLHGFAEAAGLGVVLVDTGFILTRSPDTVRGPDVAFVAGGAARNRVPIGFYPMAPDLAIEIRSPDDRGVELAEKVADYLGAGTRLVWVIDPRERTLQVFRAGGSSVTLVDGDWLDGEDVLPGFRHPVTAVLPWRPA